MKKKVPESEILLAVYDIGTRIELLGNQLDKVGAKINELLRRIPLEKPPEKTEIVGHRGPDYKPSAHAASLAARGITNRPAASLYDTPIRQSVVAPVRHHPDLGSL